MLRSRCIRRQLDQSSRNAHGSTSMFSTANPLPASFLRGGTSKGIYINREALPADKAEWTPIFLGIMGSPDPIHGRQLNGMGGGISSLSKICVVGEPSEEQREQGVDVQYTFCQIGIKDSTVDISGNCGNLSSMIGVFAVDEGICIPRVLSHSPGLGSVRSYNTNTNKRIDTTFPISQDGKLTPMLDLEQTTVAGVPGKASRIDLDFVSPAGARTGKLLPTGNSRDIAKISLDSNSFSIPMSLVDATNPSVFITSHHLAEILSVSDASQINYHTSHTEDLVEQIRRAGAELMGLDPSARAQPKIAILTMPSKLPKTALLDADTDVVAHAFSMGVLHKAIPMTLGLCLGAAAGLRDSIPWSIVHQARSTRGATQSNDESLNQGLVRITHPSGSVDVGAEFSSQGLLESAKVVRTGRRLMRGEVWW